MRHQGAKHDTMKRRRNAVLFAQAAYAAMQPVKFQPFAPFEING